MTEHDHARLVLAIVRERWDEAEALVTRSAVDPGVFVAVCRQCEVPTRIHALLERAQRWDLVGDTARALLGDFRQRIRRDNLLLLARLEQALDALLDAGVTPILLKGADTLHRFYDAFDERMLVDIDLLVRRDDLPTALRALEGAGWRPPQGDERDHYLRGSHHLPLDGPGSVPVDLELHWNLVQERRYRLEPAELFARAVPLRVAGRPVLRLEDHDAVGHLLLHHFSHYFDRGLKSLVDLGLLSSVPGFEWTGVADRLRRWHGTAAGGAAVAHIRKVWPELIPAAAVPMIPLARWRRALTWPLRSSHPLELYRNTRNRRVQLYLATVMIEQPAALPAWFLHKAIRDRRPGANPLDRA